MENGGNLDFMAYAQCFGGIGKKKAFKMMILGQFLLLSARKQSEMIRIVSYVFGTRLGKPETLRTSAGALKSSILWHMHNVLEESAIFQ